MSPSPIIITFLEFEWGAGALFIGVMVEWTVFVGR